MEKSFEVTLISTVVFLNKGNIFVEKLSNEWVERGPGCKWTLDAANVSDSFFVAAAIVQSKESFFLTNVSPARFRLGVVWVELSFVLALLRVFFSGFVRFPPSTETANVSKFQFDRD